MRMTNSAAPAATGTAKAKAMAIALAISGADSLRKPRARAADICSGVMTLLQVMQRVGGTVCTKESVPRVDSVNDYSKNGRRCQPETSSSLLFREVRHGYVTPLRCPQRPLPMWHC